MEKERIKENEDGNTNGLHAKNAKASIASRFEVEDDDDFDDFINKREAALHPKQLHQKDTKGEVNEHRKNSSIDPLLPSHASKAETDDSFSHHRKEEERENKNEISFTPKRRTVNRYTSRSSQQQLNNRYDGSAPSDKTIAAGATDNTPRMGYNNNKSNNNYYKGNDMQSDIDDNRSTIYYPDGGWSEVPAELEESLRIMKSVNIGYNLTSVMNDPNELNNQNASIIAPTAIIKEMSNMLFKQDEEDTKALTQVQSVIPPVDVNDFNEYLRVNSKLISFFKKNHHDDKRGSEKNEKDTMDQPNQELLSMIESMEKGLPAQSNGHTMFSLAMAAGASSGQSAAEKLKSLLPRCFRIVPARYLEQNFKVMVNDVAIFDSISNQNEVKRIQDMLSGCLDLVEVCLWSQTTSRAGDFFEAISYLKYLLSYVNAANATITTLRNSLNSLRQATAFQQLKMLHLKKRKENVQKLHVLAEKIVRVKATQQIIESLLTSGDFIGALSAIESTQELLSGELRGVHCIRSLSKQLLQYQDLIGNELSREFVQECAKVLDGTWELSAINDENDKSSKKIIKNEKDMVFVLLQKQLSPFVEGLLKTGIERLRGALHAHRARTFELVKLTAKSVVTDTLQKVDIDLTRDPYQPPERPSSANENDDPNDELQVIMTGGPSPSAQGSNGDNLQSQSGNDAEDRTELLVSMSASDFIHFLQLVFDSLEEIISQAMLVHNAISNILDKDLSPSSSTTTKAGVKQIGNQSENGMEDDLKLLSSRFANLTPELKQTLKNESLSVVTQICDFSQKVVIKLLKYRTDRHAKGRLIDLKQTWEKTSGFINLGEKLCNYKGMDLKNVLADQANRYLQEYHIKQKSIITKSLEDELWDVVEIPFEAQDTVNRLCAGNLQSIAQGYTNPIGLSSSSALSSILSYQTQSTAAGDGSTVNELRIYDKSYKTTASSLLMIRSLEGYLRCLLEFLVLGPRVQGLMIDILLQYNDKINRLILLTEATKGSGKLKSIKAKHLALAAQSLSVILAIIPAIDSILDKCLPQQQQQKHHHSGSSRTVNIIENHRSKIFDKLVSLIDMRLMQCCQKLSATIDWDARGTEGLGKPQKYMLDLTQGITSLHKVLNEILNKDHLQLIFNDIFKLLNTKVPELYKDVNPTTQAGKTRARVDLYQLLSSMRIRGIQGPGNSLEEWLVEKYGGNRIASSTSFNRGASNDNFSS